MSVSIIIPAFNEEQRLPKTLARLHEYLDSAGEEYEVIVVDDGSSDSTRDLVNQTAEAWPKLKLVSYGRNQGKGYAVKQGMLAAVGEHRILSDADLSAPIEEMVKLRAKLYQNCQVAIGSRGLRDSQITTHQDIRRELMGKTFNFFFQLLAIRGIHDSQCGFKAFTAEAAQKCFGPLRTKGFGFDAEVLLRARKAGYKVAEVPIRWGHVEQSRVSKVRDSARMLWDLIWLRVKGV